MDREPIDSANESRALFAPGSTAFDFYVITECLSVGKTSTMYRCYHKDFPSQQLVLKVFDPKLIQDELLVARFEKEIVTSYQLNSPHLIRSFEFIRQGGRIAYTMEYAGGGDLRNKLKDGALPIPEAVRICSEICMGLQAIHDCGVVHRDLKPQNIMFTEKGLVKIGDFGLVHTENGRKLTQHGEVLGAVDFVSPEYIQSGKLDHRSDIYSLGLIAYEMVTGQPAFSGTSLMDSLMKRLTTRPNPPSHFRPECPPLLDKAILKALETDPDKRFQTALEMLNAIQLQPARAKGAQHQTNSKQQTPPSRRSVSLKSSLKTLSPASLQSLKRRTRHQVIAKTLAIVCFTLIAGYLLSTILLEKYQRATQTAKVSDSQEESASTQSQSKGNSVKKVESVRITTRAAPAITDDKNYLVVKGDTVTSIATRFAVTPQELMTLNNIADARRLQAGQVLMLPEGGKE